MKQVLFLWDKLIWLLNQIDKEIGNKIIQIIVDYWIVFLIVWFLLYMFRLGIYILYRLASRRKYKESKSLIKVRWQVEFKVISEKLYFGFKLYKVNRIDNDDNEFRKSRRYAPSGIFELLSSIIQTMMPIRIYNVFIWGLVFVYKYPIFVNEVYKTINIDTLGNIVIYIKSIGLNKFTESLKNISFIIVSILIITGCWSYLSTYRKVNNEKLEKILAKQDRLIHIIGGILYKLEENINTFFSMKDYLNLFLCEYITHTDAYDLENKKLRIVNNYRVKPEYGEVEYIEQKLSEFKSYEEEINGLNHIIQDIEKDYLWSAIKRFYKSMWYEDEKLNIISKTPLESKKSYLLDREDLKEWMIRSSSKLLEERFEKIIKVKNGIVTKEEYEDEEGCCIKISFEDAEQFYEEQLEKKLIEFCNDVDRRLRNSIEIYLILEMYLCKLERLNWKLGFFSKIK